MASRALGPSGRGVYYVVIAAATLATVLANLGVDSAATVVHSRGHASLERLAGALAVLALATAPIVLALSLAAYAALRGAAIPGVSWTDALVVAPSIPFALHRQ